MSLNRCAHSRTFSIHLLVTPVFLLIAFLLTLYVPQLGECASPEITLNVPLTAKYGDIITITSNTGGGSEGLWLYVTGLTLKRAYFHHCGWCGEDLCLKQGRVQNCTRSCGPYLLQCVWSSGHEFSDTWYGPPTFEYKVTGCDEATVKGRYYGGSHEGPYDTEEYVIKIVDGPEISAQFTAEPDGTICAGEKVEFDASESCGAISYKWSILKGFSPLWVTETLKKKSLIHSGSLEIIQSCLRLRGATAGRLIRTTALLSPTCAPRSKGKSLISRTIPR